MTPLDVENQVLMVGYLFGSTTLGDANYITVASLVNDSMENSWARLWEFEGMATEKKSGY